MVMAQATSAVHWFRKGLRLHDNPALLDALRSAQHVWPVYCWDARLVTPQAVGVNRVQFLLQCLDDLDRRLRERQSRLTVLRGDALEVLPRFMRERQVSLLTFEGDVEPEGRARDERMLRKCHQMGVQVHSFATHLLYDPDRVIRELGADELPLSYGPFVARVTEALGAPALPLAAPPETQSFGTPDTDPQAYAVPRLEELEAYRGMTATTPLKGGETTALAVLGAFLSERRDEARQFSKPHTSPTAFEPASTTQLSPHMALGCLSARLFYYRVQELHPLRRPPVSLIGQLWWREFFTTVAYATPGFHSMKENRLCRQIPWSADAEEQYRAWEGGRTGHPFIDACMVQLRKHGWLHHLARHAVACFLSRGDLWVSWERGRDTFDRLLVDRDYALNNANWMWLSCSAFFHQYFRVYSPIKFPQRFDKEGTFVRHFLPVLRNMPAKYVYEPWKAPLSVQREAGCVVGRDYPYPIVDHEVVSKENLAKMSEVFSRERRPMEKFAKKRPRPECVE
ncbi:hypothetical protein CDCA_CDCA06G2010 [Cyanidium caldarium]|uniref:Photolyase/cryptochrome alpha/beta domain-containing protein n=1 Tax=Cyanidium caldarium TaxID=2771 RepID=A0AAV9IUK6_CYACA|nr:hypothetical protein CDCA_CDCA06G2010 [Cyanidium caldarium]